MLIPGFSPPAGTYGMEAVARQFGGPGRKCLAIRNGYFSYRWSQIFEQCLGMPEGQNPLAPGEGCHGVIRARPVEVESAARNPYAPPPLEEVRATIHRERPSLVCAPHVETSLGIMLPDEYVRGVARGRARRRRRLLPRRHRVGHRVGRHGRARRRRVPHGAAEGVDRARVLRHRHALGARARRWRRARARRAFRSTCASGTS